MFMHKKTITKTCSCNRHIAPHMVLVALFGQGCKPVGKERNRTPGGGPLVGTPQMKSAHATVTLDATLYNAFVFGVECFITNKEVMPSCFS